MKKTALLLCFVLICISCGCGGASSAAFGSFEWEYPYPDSGVTEAVLPEGYDDSSYIAGLNFIDDDTPITVPAEAENAGERTAGEPYAVDVKYDDGTGVCVAIYDVVEDFGAVNDGSANAATAIQKALFAAEEAGGGVVYIPEGIYLCETAMEIPSGVTLRGEWVSPEETPAGSCGTVLLVKTNNRGREGGAAFIRLNQGSGIRNMTIMYPEQTSVDIDKYPATLQETGGDSFTVMNMTIAGAWNAYQANLNWSELHYLKNVYITAFNNAIMIDDVTDIGRLEGVHISPDYFLENTLYPFDEAGAQRVRDYMFDYSVGIYSLRTDWEYVYDLYVEGISCALRTQYNDENRSINGQFCNVLIENCKVGIDLQATNAIGIIFSDVTITGDESCESGVILGNDFSAVCEFQNLKISGPIKQQLTQLGNGILTVVNSTFEDWDSGSSYAIDLKRGGASIQQTYFGEAEKHVSIDSSCGGVSVMGCTFEGGSDDIEYDADRPEYTKIDNTALNLPVTSGRLHVYRQSIPTASSKNVYNIADYGAKSGEDSTEALKQALAAAEQTGGVVYIPAGEYIVSEPLTVPTGVELRGIYNVPTHSITAGSVLMTNIGKGSESGDALISLSEGSGINGVSFYYTEQSYTDFIPYPYTVRSLGKNCWAINCVFINSYQAMDFGTNPSDGHYISYCSGAPLRTGIFVGSNSSNGWVENCQFNPHYWRRADVSLITSDIPEDLNNAINHTLEVFIFGDNASEHALGNFAYGGETVLKLISQGGGGTNGTIIGHGSDGCRNALVVEEADVVEFINAELVSMNYTSDMHHIVMEETVTGTVALFNSMMWAQPTESAILQHGGTLIIEQLSYYNLENTVNLVDADGGTLYYCSVLLEPKTIQIKASADAEIFLTGDLVRQSLSFAAPSGGPKITISNSGAAITEKSTWWS